ncbi:hypothetical protein F5148DRAFT_735648 [Russula earlei]|uniref:Uncharacterized protein n=1 Tax=Russula earlei TaxID=71964 RepID=A0ACC0UDG2_9AGAM|nr:hypothetical protein F5148DRAFT_735648 [Russula earlei]
MRFLDLGFFLALAATVSAGVVVDRRAAFTLQNGKDAQALNRKFRTLTPTSACTSGEVACVKGQLAECSNGKFALSPCPSTLQCVALPSGQQARDEVRARFGLRRFCRPSLGLTRDTHSVTCDTLQDAQARIANTGATGGLVGKRELEGLDI